MSSRHRNDSNPRLRRALQQRLAIEEQRSPRFHRQTARSAPAPSSQSSSSQSPAHQTAYPGWASRPSRRSAAVQGLKQANRLLPRATSSTCPPAQSPRPCPPSPQRPRTPAPPPPPSARCRTPPAPAPHPARTRCSCARPRWARASNSLGQHAFLGQQRLKKLRRTHQLDALIGQHLRHRAQQHVRIPRAQIQQQLRQSPVRPDARENLFVLHLPRHYRGLHVFFMKDLNEPRQFAQRKPVHRNLLVRRRAMIDLRVRLLANRRHRHANPCARAASSSKNGNRPFPAIKPSFTTHAQGGGCVRSWCAVPENDGKSQINRNAYEQKSTVIR